MIRTFATHSIRDQKELTGYLWDFTPLSGEFAGKTYKVPTPSCWETYPDFGAYRDQAVYKTSFYAAGNIRLEFKGVSHTATVYLDGEQIASHYNAFTMFDTVVKNLEDGEHVLEVKVDNRFSEESALHVPNDYMTYGGINRPVVLEALADVYVERIHVTPYFEEDQWHAAVEVSLKNISDQPQEVTAAVMIADNSYSLSGIQIPGNESYFFTTDMCFDDVETWTPANPGLYDVTAVLLNEEGRLIDDLIDRFGFRQVTIDGKKILLNGEPIRIKGFCRHEDHPQFGCALPYAAIAADLEIIKHLGANSVRTSHYPNDEIFLDLCDEQGILVWEENHARGIYDERMKNPNFERQCEDCIREMIPAHYNHPCIYIWGIMNECNSDRDFGREMYKKQFELIAQLDSSRPRTFASCMFDRDICLDLPEVVSFNIYPEWYYKETAADYMNWLYNNTQEKTPGAGKPFLISEIGAGGIYGYRNNYDSKWTEDYQAQALEKQLTAVLTHPDCVGVYVWQFCDVRVTEEEWFSSRPRTMNNKGVVDEFRRRKLSYNVVKRLFETLP